MTSTECWKRYNITLDLCVTFLVCSARNYPGIYFSDYCN